MSIYVIKPSDNSLRTGCPTCGCIFSFDIEDLHTYQRAGEKTEEIFCPCCHKIIVWRYGDKSGRSL